MATQTRAPTSDEAATGTLSGSAGSRWTLLDDHPDTTGADVLTFGTTTAQITFGYSAFTVPAGSTSISVQVLYYDGEASTGANNCGGRLKVGASYFNAATHNPAGTTYTSRSDNWATNPATSAAWTVDQVNGVGANALAAFGIGSTDSSPTFRVSSVQLQVTYTEPVSEIQGSATITDAADAGAATGAVDIAGAASNTDAADSVAATGTVADNTGLSGDAMIVDAADTVVAAGTIAIGGAAVAGDAADSVGATSAVAIAAGLSRTDSGDTVGAAGTVSIGGALNRTDAGDTVASAGGVAIAGAGAVSDEADAVAAVIGEQAGGGYDSSQAHHSWHCADLKRRHLMARWRR